MTDTEKEKSAQTIKDVQAYGILQAGSSQGSSESLEGHIIAILGGQIKTISKDESSQNSNNIDFQEQKKIKLQNESDDVKKNIGKLNSQRVELKKQEQSIIDGASGKSTFDAAKFGINLFFLLMLSIYLFQFYVSATNSALFKSVASYIDSINGGNSGLGLLAMSIFDPNVYSNNPSIFFLVFAPFLFYGFGYAVHILIDSENKNKKLFIWLIILVTFALDCLLAYKIHDTANQASVLIGNVDEPFYKSVNFYLVIFMGFVVYIIWGILLHALLVELQKRNPFAMIQKKLTQNQTMIEVEEKKIAFLIAEIERVGLLINSLKNGYYHTMNEFCIGWMNFVQGVKTEKPNLESECKQVINKYRADNL